MDQCEASELLATVLAMYTSMPSSSMPAATSATMRCSMLVSLVRSMRLTMASTVCSSAGVCDCVPIAVFDGDGLVAFAVADMEDSIVVCCSVRSSVVWNGCGSCRMAVRRTLAAVDRFFCLRCGIVCQRRHIKCYLGECEGAFTMRPLLRFAWIIDHWEGC